MPCVGFVSPDVKEGVLTVRFTWDSYNLEDRVRGYFEARRASRSSLTVKQQRGRTEAESKSAKGSKALDAACGVHIAVEIDWAQREHSR